MRFGISVISLMRIGRGYEWGCPGAFIEPASQTINEALEGGYDFIQALPIRGLDGTEKGLAYYERAWIDEDDVPTSWRERILFPSCRQRKLVEMQLRLSGATRISHHLGYRAPYFEIHSGLGRTAGEIIRECCEGEGSRLVLDTLHLVDRKHSSCLGLDFGEALETVGQLAPYIDVVHVHPIEPLGRFLTDPQNTQTADVLRRLWSTRSREALDYIAEYNPGMFGFLSPNRSRWLRRQFLRAMRKLVA